MPKMFHEYTDENGVTTSCNSHASSDYESRPLKGYSPHIMQNSAGQVYVDTKPATIEHETGDQVLRRVGTGRGAMSFGSLLAQGEKR